MIGLYDADFANYIPVMFNLEIMKLSSFFKKRREVVVLTQDFDPDRFSTIYFRKDYDDGFFDNKIFSSNVRYGGRAFNKIKYAPLTIEQELSEPDKTIYQRYERKYSFITTRANLYKTMSNAEHLRISLDGENFWEESINFIGKERGHMVIFHDYDLTKIKDADLIVKDILEKKKKAMYSHFPARLGIKYPIQVGDNENFKKWTQFDTARDYFMIQYNNYMTNEQLADYLLNGDGKRNGYCLTYNVTHGSSGENDFIENYLLKIFQQALFSRSLGKKILLSYDDDFFVDKRWERFIKLVNVYINSVNQDFFYRKYEPLVTTVKRKKFYISSQPNWFSIEEVREIFQMIREKNYETFKMFYIVPKIDLIGGEIVYV